MKKAQFLFLITLLIPFLDQTTHAMITKSVTRNKRQIVSCNRNLSHGTLRTSSLRQSIRRPNTLSPKPRSIYKIPKRHVTGVDDAVIVYGATQAGFWAALMLKGIVYGCAAKLGYEVYKEVSGENEKEQKQQEEYNKKSTAVAQKYLDAYYDIIREDYRKFITSHPNLHGNPDAFEIFLKERGYKDVHIIKKDDNVFFQSDMPIQKTHEDYVDVILSRIPKPKPIYIARSACSALEQKDIDDFIQTHKAPFEPGSHTGFVPPKKWDGDVVKHKPKSGKSKGFGYPDRKGRVWIPSGNDGHGGAHWDVQLPNGKHINVCPDGSIRGQKSSNGQKIKFADIYNPCESLPSIPRRYIPSAPNASRIRTLAHVINSIDRAHSLTRDDVDRFIAPGTIEEAYEYSSAINAYYDRLDAIEQSYTNTPDVGTFLDNYNSLDGQHDDVMDQARAALEKTQG